eukprot:11493498-Alexandrium_andersonii.AAC.1
MCIRDSRASFRAAEAERPSLSTRGVGEVDWALTRKGYKGLEHADLTLTKRVAVLGVWSATQLARFDENKSDICP